MKKVQNLRKTTSLLSEGPGRGELKVINQVWQSH